MVSFTLDKEKCYEEIMDRILKKDRTLNLDAIFNALGHTYDKEFLKFIEK